MYIFLLALLVLVYKIEKYWCRLLGLGCILSNGLKFIIEFVIYLLL